MCVFVFRVDVNGRVNRWMGVPGFTSVRHLLCEALNCSFLIISQLYDVN